MDQCTSPHYSALWCSELAGCSLVVSDAGFERFTWGRSPLTRHATRLGLLIATRLNYNARPSGIQGAIRVKDYIPSTHTAGIVVDAHGIALGAV